MAPGLQRFEIILENPDKTFAPGEIVNGKVIVDLNETESIRGFKVRIKGKAEVHWTESSTQSNNNHQNSNTYRAEEEYFGVEYYILGQAGSSENVEIQPGHHEYPFDFCLPLNIPSSFKHPCGSVTYTVKAVMDRPWKFDHQTSRSFNVETPYDITQCPTALDIIEDEDLKTFCCLFPFCNQGSMHLDVHIPKSAFAVGDIIDAKIHINNKSNNVDVTKVKLLLEQKIKLHSRFPHSKTRKYNQTVQEKEYGGPISKDAELTMSILVPQVPSSNLPYCNIIDIDYCLNVEVCVSGCHCSMTKSYPVVIGTRPAINFQPMQPQYGVPGFFQKPFEQIGSNRPSVPFFSDVPPTSGGNIPFASASHNQTFPSVVQNPSAATPFRHSGDTAPPIGFVLPSQESSAPTIPPEIAPPSYEACMGIGHRK